MSELKPCPFCGGAPEISETMDTVCVTCNHCDVFDVQSSDEKEKAITAWNTRPQPSSGNKTAVARNFISHGSAAVLDNPLTAAAHIAGLCSLIEEAEAATQDLDNEI